MRFDKEQALHALDLNQLLDVRQGYGSIEGGPIEQFGDNSIRAPTPWELMIDGERVFVDSDENELTLSSADALDRWDVLYIDSDGALQVKEGEPSERTGEQGKNARTPVLPTDIPGTVVGTAYRRGGEANVSTELVFSRSFDSAQNIATLQIAPWATGTLTATGGEDPAALVTETDVRDEETTAIEVLIAPETEQSFSYAYNTEHSRAWDGSQLDVDIQVVWDEDPGDGNDIDMEYKIVPRY